MAAGNEIKSVTGLTDEQKRAAPGSGSGDKSPLPPGQRNTAGPSAAPKGAFPAAANGEVNRDQRADRQKARRSRHSDAPVTSGQSLGCGMNGKNVQYLLAATDKTRSDQRSHETPSPRRTHGHRRDIPGLQ